MRIWTRVQPPTVWWPASRRSTSASTASRRSKCRRGDRTSGQTPADLWGPSIGPRRVSRQRGRGRAGLTGHPRSVNTCEPHTSADHPFPSRRRSRRFERRAGSSREDRPAAGARRNVSAIDLEVDCGRVAICGRRRRRGMCSEGCGRGRRLDAGSARLPDGRVALLSRSCSHWPVPWLPRGLLASGGRLPRLRRMSLSRLRRMSLSRRPLASRSWRNAFAAWRRPMRP